QARIVAAPATYLANGQQQVAILVGARGLPANGNRTSAVSANNSRLLVYATGGNKTLPTETVSATAAGARVTINPPLMTASTEAVFEGEQAFGANCAVCHGQTAVPGAGSIAPDLRYSALLGARGNWNTVVRDGNFATRGMPAFGDRLTAETTDAILA